MSEELKKELQEIDSKIEFLNSIADCFYDTISLCQKLETGLNITKESTEVIFLPINNQSIVSGKFRDSLSLLEKHFSTETNLLCKSEEERTYLVELFSCLYGSKKVGGNTSHGLVSFFDNLASHNSDDVLKKIKSLSDILFKLQKIKEKENKNNLKFNSNPELTQELDVLKNTYYNVESIRDKFKKITIANSIKSQFNLIKSKINECIENNLFQKRVNTIQDILYSLEKKIKEHTLPLNSLNKIYNLIQEEAKVIINKKEEVEQSLKSDLKYNKEIMENPQLEKIESKSNFNTKILNNVFSSARDPYTAIKHSEIGRELQLFFNKSNNNKVTKELDEKVLDNFENNQVKDEAQKAEVKKWFKYGEEKNTVEKNLKELTKTTFGISLNKLLEANGIDPNILSKYKSENK
ncbi:MAG: hypothetical protein U0457_14495 [Candidatus Sericytochromatia bacterium]